MNKWEDRMIDFEEEGSQRPNPEGLGPGAGKKMTGIDKDIFRATRRLTTLLNEACNHRNYLCPYLEKLDEAANMALEGYQKDYPVDVAAIIADDRKAMIKPRRNCDVGTPDEQAERFENFCLKYIGCAEETGGRHCVGCPMEKASKNITQKCELYWAQLPSEEGGAK